MKEFIFWLVAISILIGILGLSFKGGKEETNRKETCNFICYKEACKKGQVNQIIKSECIDAEILGKCLSCSCSFSIVAIPVEV